MLEYIIVNLAWLTGFIYLNRKLHSGMHILQLEHYKIKAYKKWIKEHLKKVYKLKEIILIIPIILLLFDLRIAMILEFILFLLLNIFYKSEKEKKPFVITNRIKRMYITDLIVFIIVLILTNIFINQKIINLLLNIIYIFYIIASYYVVILLNTINKPIENIVQRKFYKQAERKLKENSNLKIIGITGSYGKTSTKYIVSTILEQKYNVLKTPESYNTTMGVVRTINENLKPEHQVFVCEMGARNIGDIKEICDLVKPKYGILTSVGPQHLETFKTIENVRKTKFELINSLPENGIAFVNGDDENILVASINKQCITYGLNEEKCDYYANNIEISETGCSFEIHTKSKDIINVKTKLLGKHNILNILGAVCVAKELGLTNDEIKQGVRLLKPIPHRLELINGANGLIVIDDAFNSNVKGAKSALEVLSNFKNYKKILVTPGMVELGDKQYDYNKEFGKQIAHNADYVILVGKKQAEPILDGLKEENYFEKNIYIAENLEDAINQMNNEITQNTVILLENDLPDNYL